MINWGIIGLGNMANKFASAITEVENSKLISIASNSRSKLDLFAKNFKIEKENKFNNYADLIKSKKINAIYISTLNNTHVGLILDCAKNDKKILCEKPIGLNLDQANLALEAINEKNISFYEAIAYRSHPQTKNLLELIYNGEIGEIYKIEASFGFKIKKIKKDSRLFNKDLGGGAILDVGCYPVSFFQLFCSKEEKLELIDVKGSHAITGVDDYAEINLLSKNNIEFYGKVSLKENFDNQSKIYGTKGSIVVPSPWLPSKKSYLEIIKGSSYYKNFINTDSNVYTIQIKNVSNRFSNVNNEAGKLLIDINDSVNIMKILDLWSKKIDK